MPKTQKYASKSLSVLQKIVSLTCVEPTLTAKIFSWNHLDIHEFYILTHKVVLVSSESFRVKILKFRFDCFTYTLNQYSTIVVPMQQTLHYIGTTLVLYLFTVQLKELALYMYSLLGAEPQSGGGGFSPLHPPVLLLWTTMVNFGQFWAVSTPLKIVRSCSKLSEIVQSTLADSGHSFLLFQLWGNYFQLWTCLGASTPKT